jgi:acyl-CoA synthetase (AMP-forming)/AMP-acid ligase II
VIVGGAACPLSVMEDFDRYGVETRVGWGMTEMSPLGTVNESHRGPREYGEERLRSSASRPDGPIFGVEMKIVDDDGKELPWDGEAFGSLKVRGPWICSDYFKLEGSRRHAEEGWFETGDVATIDPEGYMAITDRTKDVIKSGGEWISSIDVENVATDHPKVAEAAVIGRYHPKWSERPLLIVVRQRRMGEDLTPRRCWPGSMARSPSGGRRMRWSSSTSCPTAPRARSTRWVCASSSRTTPSPAEARRAPARVPVERGPSPGS